MLMVHNGQITYEMLAVTEDANQMNAPELTKDMETHLSIAIHCYPLLSIAIHCYSRSVL